MRLVVDGDDLVLKGSAPPPPRVFDLLRRHKAEIMLLLRPADDGWSADDWQVFFDERAGIAESEPYHKKGFPIDELGKLVVEI